MNILAYLWLIACLALQYGTVLDVKVPRPILNENGKMDKKASEALPDLGKVFVMYEKVEHTKAAMMSIA